MTADPALHTPEEQERPPRAPGAGTIVALLLVAAVAETVLLGIDSGLRRLELAGSASYGMGDLGSVSGGHAAQTAHDAVRTWHSVSATGTSSYRTWATWYLLVDTLLLVPAYLLAIRGAARRVRPDIGLWWLGIILLAELVQNGLQGVLAYADPNAWSWRDDAAAWIAAGAGIARWAVLVVGVAVLGLHWLEAPGATVAGRTSSRLSAVRAAVAKRRSAWAPLRAPLVLVALAGAFLVLPVSDQPPDVLRRWLDRQAADRWHALAALAAVVAFALGIWLAGRRVADRPVGPPRKPVSPGGMLLVALVVALLAALPGVLGAGMWRRLGALFVILVVVALLTRLSGVKWREREAVPQQWSRASPERGLVERHSRWLSAAVLAVVGLACVRAFTPTVFLVSEKLEPTRWRWDLVGLVGGAMLATAGTLGWYGLLKRLDEVTDAKASPDFAPLVAASLVVALLLAYLCWPGHDGLPRTLTALGVLVLALLILTLVAGEITRWVESGMPARPFRALGLTRTPAFALLGAWFLLTTPFDPGGFHDVRVAPEKPASRTPAVADTTVREVLRAWRGRAGCRSAKVKHPATPLLLAAASGGGIRAAYWSRTVLDDLTRGSCAKAALFAASGISGGSLGLVSYTSPRRGGSDPLAADNLSPTLASLLFVDLPRSLVGFHAPDRAERLEEGWQHADPALAKSFDSLGHVPLLLLNGATVEGGCRFNVAQVEFGAEPLPGKGVDCRALDQYRAAGSVAAGTVDLTDFLCRGQHVRRSTAALLSARFPLVSPAGRMEECAHPRREARITYVVDGGYIDRTGAAAMLDLWHAIEPEVRRRKRQGDCLVPVFVQLENSYERLATAPAGSRPGELTVPLRAYGEAGADRQWVVSAQAQRAFGPQHYVRLAPTRRPGVQAPLGWVLSGTAQRDLDEQRQKLRSDPRVGWHRLRKLLEGRTPCPRR